MNNLQLKAKGNLISKNDIAQLESAYMNHIISAEYQKAIAKKGEENAKY